MEEHQLLLVSLAIAFMGVWAAIGALALGEQLSKARHRRLSDSGVPAAGVSPPGPHYAADRSTTGDQPPARKRSRTRRSSSAS
ncbi:MAG: hypothetical protein AAFV43_10475 [Planctomycetota bacterium]